jgi:2-methylcitrate dehydratase PrpD
MATTPVHGVLERFGSAMTHWHKYAMYGAVAEAGVNAALLAKEGFLADDKALDRDGTSYRAFGASKWDPDLLVEGLGSRWLIAETSIKRYPFCRYAAGAIDLFDRIVRDEDLVAADIEEVVVTVPPFKFLQFIADMPLPSQPFEIMVSLRYAYALIAAGVPAGPAWWDQANVDDPAHRAFAAKIRSAVNPEWRSVMVDQIAAEGYFREIPISLEVRTTAGIAITATSSYAKGDPWGPGSAMTDDELSTKVRDFTTPALGPDRAERLIDAGYSLAGAANLEAFVGAMARGDR